MASMAAKHHPTPLSGRDRKALSKELTKARAMTGILADRSAEKRAAGEACDLAGLRRVAAFAKGRCRVNTRCSLQRGG